MARRRRRRCLSCGHTFTTFEVAERDMLDSKGGILRAVEPAQIHLDQARDLLTKGRFRA